MQRRRLRGPQLSSLVGRAESAAAQPAGLRTQKALRGWHQGAQEACNVPVVHGSATANAATRAVGWRLWPKGGAPRGRGGDNGGDRACFGARGGVWGGAAARVARVPRPRRRPGLPRSLGSGRGLRVVALRAGGPRTHFPRGVASNAPLPSSLPSRIQSDAGGRGLCGAVGSRTLPRENVDNGTRRSGRRPPHAASPQGWRNVGAVVAAVGDGRRLERACGGARVPLCWVGGGRPPAPPRPRLPPARQAEGCSLPRTPRACARSLAEARPLSPSRRRRRIKG